MNLSTDDPWAPTQLLTRHAGDQGDDSVLVCSGDSCKARGSKAVWNWLREEQSNRDARGQGSMLIAQTTCLGRCHLAPIVQVVSGGYCTGRNEAEIVSAIQHQLEKRRRTVDAL